MHILSKYIQLGAEYRSEPNQTNFTQLNVDRIATESDIHFTTVSFSFDLGKEPKVEKSCLIRSLILIRLFFCSRLEVLKRQKNENRKHNDSKVKLK